MCVCGNHLFYHASPPENIKVIQGVYLVIMQYHIIDLYIYFYHAHQGKYKNKSHRRYDEVKRHTESGISLGS